MLVLELADRVPVVHDVVRLFDVTVHHGGGGPEALAMSLPVHVQPRAGPSLLGLDALAHALREHLRAAAGQGVLAGFA